MTARRAERDHIGGMKGTGRSGARSSRASGTATLSIDQCHRDPAVRAAAARAWCAWEDVHVSLDPNWAPNPRFTDPAFSLPFATLVIHYWKHAAFIAEPGLLATMGCIAHIPGVLIHGRYDVSSPLETAWDLHHAWPQSDLVVVEGEGHGGTQMFAELTRAIARFAPA